MVGAMWDWFGFGAGRGYAMRERMLYVVAVIMEAFQHLKRSTVFLDLSRACEYILG